MRVSSRDLVGPALDWAVASAVGIQVCLLAEDNPEEKWQVQRNGYPHGPYWPSQDWAQGGPIIQAERISIFCEAGESASFASCNIEEGSNHWYVPFRVYGDTSLIAACRAIVIDKLGDIVEIPQELTP